MFAFIGRIIAGLSVLGFIICACFTFNAPESVGLNVYCIAIAVLIGLVEMPLICSCFRWCECVARYMKYITGWWWARSVMYILLTAGAYAIYATQHVQNIYMVIVLAALDAAALCFLVATVRAEPNPAYELLFKGKKPDGTAAGSGSSSGGGGWFGSSKKKAQAAAADAAASAGAAAGAAAGKSAAQQMFGGGDEEAAVAPSFEKRGSTTGAGAAATGTSNSKASGMFTGGGLFGGGGSKYGYSSDTPEANPFVS